MIMFIDYNNKIVYIMACKCGTTTIANMLNVNIHTEYDNDTINNTLNNSEYKKIIIIRKSIIDRFLSGFYEDLFNNFCYDNMDITFNDYLLFLQKCYKEKIPNVNNLNVYNNNLDIPVWFGNCSNVSLNITDETGNFCSHIMSQKYHICNIVNAINCKNVEIIELSKLNTILPNIERYNKKEKIKVYVNISNLSLNEIKLNKLIITKKYLNKRQKKIILNIYKEDRDFFNELNEKFN
jgi:hypothetical protein